MPMVEAYASIDLFHERLIFALGMCIGEVGGLVVLCREVHADEHRKLRELDLPL